MYLHCGLLDPLEDREKLLTFRRSNWHTLPDDLRRELRIWLAMPGFTIRYHVETLQHDARLVKQFMGAYEEFKDDVLENWVSATKDDCIRLGYDRPGKGDLPLLTKLEIRREYVRGIQQKDIAEEFGVAPATVNRFCWSLPGEVETLPEDLYLLLTNDQRLNIAPRQYLANRRLARLGEHVIMPENSLSPEMAALISDLMARVPAYESQESQKAALPPLVDQEKLIEILNTALRADHLPREGAAAPRYSPETLERVAESMARVPALH